MSDLQIPTPCHESWDGMTPAGNGRHCATCNHVVIDIASMPVAEGRRVLEDVANTMADNGKRTCVRAHATPGGRLVPGRRKLLTTALAGMLACTFAGCIGDGPDVAQPQSRSDHTTTVQVGQVAAPKPGDTAPQRDVPPPLTGTPVPRPKTPDDGIVVGTVHVDDAPRTPPEPEIIRGKVVAPTQK